MTPSRITFIISSLRSGGAERVLSILTKALAERGLDITVISLAGDEPFYEMDSRVRVNLLALDAPSRNIFHAIRKNIERITKLRREILESRPDVVISFLDRVNVLTLIATTGMNRVPVIVSERSVPGVRSIGGIWEWLRRVTYQRANAVTVQSTDAARFFGFLNPDKLHILANPVIKPTITGPTAPCKTYLVTVARFTEEKRLTFLIESFAKAFPEGEPELVIVGDGPDRRLLEEKAKVLGVAERVHFVGRTPEPHRIVSEAQLYLMTSRVEGFPMAVCEALALGVPVVATRCPGGVQDILRDGINGLCVSAEQFEAALREGYEKREAFRPNCAEVTERFALEATVDRWMALATQCFESITRSR